MPGRYGPEGPVCSSVSAEVWLWSIWSADSTSVHGPFGPVVDLYTPSSTLGWPVLILFALCTTAYSRPAWPGVLASEIRPRSLWVSKPGGDAMYVQVLPLLVDVYSPLVGLP